MDSPEEEDVMDGSVDPGRFDWSDGIVPTENQQRVARNLGCEDGVLERMGVEGMSREAYYCIVPAEAAEVHMTQKYGMRFEAVDAYLYNEVQSDGSGTCMITVKPTEGTFKDREYLVSSEWGSSGAPIWKEKFFPDYIRDAYKTYLEEGLQSAILACTHEVVIGAELSKFDVYGDEYGPTTPIGEVAASCNGTLYVFFAPDENLTHESYEVDRNSVLRAVGKLGMPLTCTSASITKLYPGEELTGELGISIIGTVVLDAQPRYRWLETDYLPTDGEK